ncbi:Lrp/AsnC ligand binding domain-containing protein [Candidatus Woesearchaeota archaeon]|nr:Lrp/AsnC ligand binding domain-containing protein [Candidatus Woesearchaeota archaeon]
MVRAYVMIAVEGVDVNKVAKELTNIEEIENVHLIYGEYDIMVHVKSKNLIDLKELALEKIGKVKGVVKTSTLIVADEE